MKLIAATAVSLLLWSLAFAQEAEPKPDMNKLLGKHTFARDKASLPYRLLKPDGYAKDGKDRYPRHRREGHRQHEAAQEKAEKGSVTSENYFALTVPIL